ncbi:MAG TPA: Lpg1974 family pore-forming outer membrane protein [Rhabdochlamydiaceae bacterium]|jgi:hypothetical protein
MIFIYLLCFTTLLCLPCFSTDKQEERETIKEQASAPASAPKKNKPHFVGVRRPAEKSEQKKSSPKVKNKWVKTETYPKAQRKQPAKPKAENPPPTSELPPHLPYLSRRHFSPLDPTPYSTASLLLPEPDDTSAFVQTKPASPVEESIAAYPPMDKENPRGHIFFTGEWLYWRFRQADMEFAVEGTATSSEAPFPHSATAKINFPFSSGFRVGFGVHLPTDGWDIYVNYTDIHPKASKSVEGFLFPLLIYNPLFPAAKAEGKWHVGFQTIDIEISRAYCISTTLCFRPFFGMTGAWIDQRAQFHYLGGAILLGEVDRVKTRNDFKGAGPRFGLGSNWQWGGGFSLFGNLATALVMGHFDLQNKQQQGPLETIHLNSDLNQVSPALQLVAGIAWDRRYHRDLWHCGLSLGFESLYYWRQNQMERFTDTLTPTYVRADSDLGFYGLTLRGRLDF